MRAVQVTEFVDSLHWPLEMNTRKVENLRWLAPDDLSVMTYLPPHPSIRELWEIYIGPELKRIRKMKMAL